MKVCVYLFVFALAAYSVSANEDDLYAASPSTQDTSEPTDEPTDEPGPTDNPSEPTGGSTQEPVTVTTEASPFNSTCQKDDDCSSYESETGDTTAFCNLESFECECNDKKNVQFYEETGFCERILGGECETDEQCSHIDNAGCEDSECTCDSKYETDSDDKLFSCKKNDVDNGSSTMISSLVLLVSSVLFASRSC